MFNRFLPMKRQRYENLLNIIIIIENNVSHRFYELSKDRGRDLIVGKEVDSVGYLTH